MPLIEAVCLMRVTTNRTHEINEPIELEQAQFDRLEKIGAVKMPEPSVEQRMGSPAASTGDAGEGEGVGTEMSVAAAVAAEEPPAAAAVAAEGAPEVAEKPAVITSKAKRS